MNSDEWSEIHRLTAKGMSIKGIAAHLGMSRNTVRRALSFDAPPPDHRPGRGSATDAPPPDHRPGRGSATDAFAEQIRALLVAEPGLTITQIGERIGWERSRTTLAKRVEQERRLMGTDAPPHRGVAFSAPEFATEFIGRRAELRQLRELLGAHRLVTITGVGGVGKTRLATQTAVELRRGFTDGVRVVELASLRNPALLAQTVFDGLGIAHLDQPDRSVVDALVEHVRTRHMLIVLVVQAIADNGLFWLLVPQEFGGAGQSLVTSLKVVEELARADGSTGWAFMANAFSTGIAARLPERGRRRRPLRRATSARTAGSATTSSTSPW